MAIKKPIPPKPGKGKKKKPKLVEHHVSSTTKSKPKVPAWQDSEYQKQNSYLGKLLKDFNAKQIRTRAEAATYYGTEATKDQYSPDSKKKVEIKQKPLPKNPKGKKLPPVKKKYKTVVTKGKLLKKGSAATDGLYQKELASARKQDKIDITDDYAGRGTLHSGLYAQKQGDYETEYGKQVAETNRQKAKKYGDLASEKTDFLRQQELEKEQARLEAIRRRAAKTGKVA